MKPTVELPDELIRGVKVRAGRPGWRVKEVMAEVVRRSLAKAPPDIEDAWAKLPATSTPSPKIWMDAYPASFASCAGYTLVRTEAAIERFPSLDLQRLVA